MNNQRRLEIYLGQRNPEARSRLKTWLQARDHILPYDFPTLTPRQRRRLKKKSRLSAYIRRNAVRAGTKA